MLPLPFALVLGFVQHAAVLHAGERADLPRLGVRPMTPLPPTPPPRRLVPCICCDGGRVGGRVGGRAADKDRTPDCESKERGILWKRGQKVVAVLVPAVVLALACGFSVPSQWQLMDSPHAQQEVVCEASISRLGKLEPDDYCDYTCLGRFKSYKDPSQESEAQLEALGCASSSARYPGSRYDLASAGRYYDEGNGLKLFFKLVTIRAKEGVHRNVESAKWTYPGWRADAAKVFDTPLLVKSDASQAMKDAVISMDRKQSRHEMLPPSALSSVWTSVRSDLGYAFRISLLPLNMALNPSTDSLVGQSKWFSPLFFCGVCGASLFWLFEFTTYFVTWFGRECNHEFIDEWVPRLAFAASGSVALLASSSIGFLPLVFVGTYYGLQAVLLNEERLP